MVIVCFGEFSPKLHSDRTQRVKRLSYSAGFSCNPGPDTKPLLYDDCLGGFSRLVCFVHSGSHRERLDIIWTQVHSQVWFWYNCVGCMTKMFGGNGPLSMSRCNHLAGDPKEVSPVIDQMLECTWQLTEQFPCAFEFNERFLITIHSHIYSCQYGNFIGNNQRERRKLGWALHLQSSSALPDRTAGNSIVIFTKLKDNNAKIHLLLISSPIISAVLTTTVCFQSVWEDALFMESSLCKSDRLPKPSVPAWTQPGTGTAPTIYRPLLFQVGYDSKCWL